MPPHPILAQLSPDPIDPAQVLAGDPRAGDLVLSEGDAGTAGLWRCAPGSFADVEVEESFLVLAGDATLRYEDGRSFALCPGVAHSFRGGERTVWIVREELLKVYWIAGG